MTTKDQLARQHIIETCTDLETLLVDQSLRLDSAKHTIAMTSSLMTKRDAQWAYDDATALILMIFEALEPTVKPLDNTLLELRPQDLDYAAERIGIQRRLCKFQTIEKSERMEFLYGTDSDRELKIRHYIKLNHADLLSI